MLIIVLVHGVVLWVLIRVLLLKSKVERKPARWFFAMLLFPCLPWAELLCPCSQSEPRGKSITLCRVVAFCFAFTVWLSFIANVPSLTSGRTFNVLPVLLLNAPLILSLAFRIARCVDDKRAPNSSSVDASGPKPNDGTRI